MVFRGETAPENLTGPIKACRPTHLVIVDSADMGLPPGRTALIEPEDLAAGRPFSTHALPITVLVRYLLAQFPCQVTIVGIQPHSMEFGRPVHPAVVRAAHHVALELHRAAWPD